MVCVGRVVDGTSSEKSNFTTQNFIAAFSKKRLKHVITMEYPPAYPVGSKYSSSKRVIKFTILYY